MENLSQSNGALPAVMIYIVGHKVSYCTLSKCSLNIDQFSLLFHL